MGYIGSLSLKTSRSVLKNASPTAHNCARSSGFLAFIAPEEQRKLLEPVRDPPNLGFRENLQRQKKPSGEKEVKTPEGRNKGGSS